MIRALGNFLHSHFFQSVRMFSIEGDRVGFEDVMNTQGLIDLVQMIHFIVVFYHVAQVTAA